MVLCDFLVVFFKCEGGTRVPVIFYGEGGILMVRETEWKVKWHSICKTT